MRKSLLEKLREAKAGVTTVQQKFNSLQEFYALLLGGPPNPTQWRFINARERIRGYKGPAGCAKTSTIAALGWGRCLLVPGSRIYVSRQDYNDLMQTTTDELTKMLGRLPKGTLLDRDKSPPMTWYIKPVTVENISTAHDDEVSRFVFMGLKEGLGSIQATGWLVDEADEVEEKRIHEINARLRAPGVPPEDYFIATVFNPPDKHHWLYTACTGRNHEERKIAQPYMTLYEPQPKENVKNLPPDYYEQLTKSLPEDMRQRLVDGLWGATFDGQPVYREFKRGWHVRKNLIAKLDETRPLVCFWDFGYRRPAFLTGQVDFRGVLRMFKEVLGENEEIVPFVRRIKAQLKLWFPAHMDIIHFGDPAVRQKKDTGSTVAELHKEGIRIQYKISTIDHGLKVGRLLLEQVIDGEPAVQFDEKGVPILIQAMSGGYRMDEHGAKPKKDGFYDHEADAFRYGVDNLFSGSMAQKSVNHMGPMPESVEYDPNFDR